MPANKNPSSSPENLDSVKECDERLREPTQESQQPSAIVENPWITKKQIAHRFGEPKAAVEALVTLGYLTPIRRADGGYCRKNQRIYWEFYLDDVLAGIQAFREGLPPPKPTFPKPQQKNPWEA